MLHALGVSFGCLSGRANGDEEVDDKTVAGASGFRESPSGVSEKEAAIWTCGYKPFPSQPRNVLKGRWMGNPLASGDVGRPRLAVGREEVSNHFHIILKQRGRSLSPSLAETFCLRLGHVRLNLQS